MFSLPRAANEECQTDPGNAGRAEVIHNFSADPGAIERRSCTSKRRPIALSIVAAPRMDPVEGLLATCENAGDGWLVRGNIEGVGGSESILGLPAHSALRRSIFFGGICLLPPPPRHPYLRRSFSRRADLFVSLHLHYSFFLFHQCPHSTMVYVCDLFWYGF